MAASEPRAFDFTKPGGLAGGSADALSVWLEACCSMFNEMWTEIASTSRVFATRFSQSDSFSSLRESWDADSIVYKIHVGNSEMLTLLHIDRPIALAYALEMIGEACTELPEDRELSPIEESLLELFVENLASIFGTAWPKQQPIRSRFGDRLELPHRSRDFLPSDTLEVHKLVVESDFGTHEMLWIAPTDELEELLAVPTQDETPSSNVSRQQIEIVAREIPLQVSVELGSAQVPVAELPNLAIGDLIVLDQRIEEPISIRVENHVKFSAWPGCKGTRHAAQIESSF